LIGKSSAVENLSAIPAAENLAKGAKYTPTPTPTPDDSDSDDPETDSADLLLQEEVEVEEIEDGLEALERLEEALREEHVGFDAGSADEVKPDEDL